MHDDPAEDAALARRVGAGDAVAETELCRRMFPRIRAYGLRHLREAAGAADLAQEVLVIVIEALRAGRVEQPERLAAFVMGACRNTLLDWRKTEHRRGALLERFGPSFASAVEYEPAPLDRTKLEQCLGHLPARERTIVMLTYFSEREGDEIAHELAMTAGNVRVARHRALRHLYDCMTEAHA